MTLFYWNTSSFAHSQVDRLVYFTHFFLLLLHGSKVSFALIVWNPFSHVFHYILDSSFLSWREVRYFLYILKAGLHFLNVGSQVISDSLETPYSFILLFENCCIQFHSFHLLFIKSIFNIFDKGLFTFALNFNHSCRKNVVFIKWKLYWNSWHTSRCWRDTLKNKFS